MSGQQWMSLRAYARHRGVALSAVQKAIESRRVTAIREDKGRIVGIDQVEADRQWAANTDPVEAARSGASTAAPALSLVPPPAPGGAAGERGAPADQVEGEKGDFLAARIREANLRGELLGLDKLERLGLLVSAAEVDNEVQEIFAQLKNNVFRIADRKAQVLAAETDPVRIDRLLREEIRMVFDECSRRLADSVAGRTEERATALS